MKLLQILGIILITIIIANFFLFVAGRISTTVFWVTIIIIGIPAFLLRYAKSIKKEKKKK